MVGVPLRDVIEEIVRQPESIRSAKQQRGISPDALHVVVMTGSLGAQRVNDAVVELADLGRSLRTLYLRRALDAVLKAEVRRTAEA